MAKYARPAPRDHAPASAPRAAPDVDGQAMLADDRGAFERSIESYLDQLLRAARREVRYRIAMGDLLADDMTPEELVGETLVRAWTDRQRRPPLLPVRVWLIALMFRVSESFVRREAKFRKMTSVSLETELPPEPIYDDDESFWEWYMPDEMARWEDVVPDTYWSPEDLATADEDVDRLPPRMHQVFVMHDVHQIPLREVAAAMNISYDEARKVLDQAHHRLREISLREKEGE